MDTITRFVGSPGLLWTALLTIVALLSVGFGTFWLFKQARLGRLAELRKRLDEMGPADPEYGAVRALYTSMVIDAARWGFFHSDTGSGGGVDGADHGGAGHAGDGGSDGGH